MEQQKATSVEVKRVNKRKVFSYICQQKETSRQEIAHALHMSMPTVLQNVKELQESGYLQETGQYGSTGGRKATIITSRPSAKIAIGMEITRNHIGLVLINLIGEILVNKRIRMSFVPNEDYYVKLGELVRELVADQENLEERLAGVGISIPGILDEKKKVITYSHALGIRDLHCSVLTQYIPWPASFLNDANAAGLAERHCMAPDSTMVYLSLSNSVGGAVFIDGLLYEGKNQRSGEFGHMRLVPKGKKCYCGQQGCFDSYCSALLLSSVCDGNLARFFQMLQQGEPKHVKIWKDYLESLAAGVINLRMAFDCDVVLGGYVGAYLEPYLAELRAKVGALDTFEDQKGITYLRICHYKQEASAFGAALELIERFINQI